MNVHSTKLASNLHVSFFLDHPSSEQIIKELTEKEPTFENV
jgi:hypothetical protein